MDEESIKERVKDFLAEGSVFNRKKSMSDREPFSYYDSLLELALEYPDNKSLYVEYRHIEIFDKDLADTLIENPKAWLEKATAAIEEMPIPAEKKLKDVTIRIIGLPQEYEVPISQLRHNHAGTFVAIRGVINRASPVKATYVVAGYKCLRCDYITVMPQSPESEELQEPFGGCENPDCGKKGPWTIEKNYSVMTDTQNLIIQEPLDNLRGRQPASLKVSVSDDIVGQRIPGEKVLITGILSTKYTYGRQGQKTKTLEWVFRANSISLADMDYENLDISDKDEEKIKEYAKNPNIKEILIRSVAPAIYGLRNVKAGLIIQQFSGERFQEMGGTWCRGDIHIIMFGDPSVAKSQMLERINLLAPRSIMVSGRSASAAGLTGAAVQDENNQWSIEAGALTMAGEGGICIVDEADKMREHDRSSVHQAMEQQKISVAKAGIVTELPAVCSILAAANPKKGNYDPYESIVSQFNMDPAFLSRMDFIFVMRDVPDKDKDTKIMAYMLWGEKANEILGIDPDEETDFEILDTDFLRKYIAYARMNCHPVMSDEAKKRIVDFYTRTRNNSRSNREHTVTVTARIGRACVRISTAIAKMRLSDTVTDQDAKDAIRLLIDNLREVGVDPETGCLDAAVIEIGVSRSQSRNMDILTKIIRNLQEISTEKDKSARVDDVIKEAMSQNVRDPDKLLAKMAERGILFKPQKNYVKLVH